jgi:hypothetical protein
MATDADAAARVAGLDWWHTIEVAPGVVTPGGWDLRATAERVPWPPSLAGMRCLASGLRQSLLQPVQELRLGRVQLLARGVQAEPLRAVDLRELGRAA